jgi:hypothetical protein
LKNDDLIAAIRAFLKKTDDLELGRAVYRALSNAKIVVAFDRSPVPLNEDQFFIRTYRDSTGTDVVTVYSSFGVAPVDAPHEVMPFVYLCRQLTKTDTAVRVNASAPYLIIPPIWVRAIAEGAEMPAPVVTLEARPQRFRVEPARPVSATVLERLRQGLVANASISEAFLAHVFPDDSDQGFLTVGYVLDSRERSPAVSRGAAERLHSWVRPVLGDEEIDFLELKPDKQLLADFKAAGAAFYRRAAVRQ